MRPFFLSSNILDNVVDVLGPSETLTNLRAAGPLLDISVTAVCTVSKTGVHIVKLFRRNLVFLISVGVGHLSMQIICYVANERQRYYVECYRRYCSCHLIRNAAISMLASLSYCLLYSDKCEPHRRKMHVNL